MIFLGFNHKQMPSVFNRQIWGFAVASPVKKMKYWNYSPTGRKKKKLESDGGDDMMELYWENLSRPLDFSIKRELMTHHSFQQSTTPCAAGPTYTSGPIKKCLYKNKIQIYSSKIRFTVQFWAKFHFKKIWIHPRNLK